MIGGGKDFWLLWFLLRLVLSSSPWAWLYAQRALACGAQGKVPETCATSHIPPGRTSPTACPMCPCHPHHPPTSWETIPLSCETSGKAVRGGGGLTTLYETGTPSMNNETRRKSHNKKLRSGRLAAGSVHVCRMLYCFMLHDQWIELNINWCVPNFWK